MFIKYNPKEPHVKTIPVVIKSSGNESVPLANDSVILRPGTNELTESEWVAIQPHVQDEVKHKIIIPFTVEVKKDGKVAKARTLKDVPVSVARKIIESCQNVSDLKRWVRQELPDEIMLLVLKRLRKFKIDPDDFGYDLSGEEDTLDADITLEDGTVPESEADTETPEDEESGKTGGKDDLHEDSNDGKRRGKKNGKKNQLPSKPEPKGSGDENEPEDEEEVPDFDGFGGKE